MCGICGIISLDRKVSELPFKAGVMVQSMYHRGPDDYGYLFDEELRTDNFNAINQELINNKIPYQTVSDTSPMVDSKLDFVKSDFSSFFLGHRRLSIIDLSEHGRQPMSMDAGQLWITYNGEIYNYKEIRTELVAKGYQFHTNTDTEVILSAYNEWGEDCIHHFNGMWAFLIWDNKNKRAFASRDRFGIKPFYYAWDGTRFIFASEIKSIILAFPELREENESYVYEFLKSARQDFDNQTSYRSIFQIEPGHSLSLSNNSFRLYRYWDYSSDSISRYDYNNPQDTFDELLSSAISLRMRSDVSLGTCLSGGLDSSSIVAHMSHMSPFTVKTFSSIYHEPGCNEESFVEIINDYCQCDAHKVFPRQEDFWDLMPELMWYQDEPVSAPGVYSQWHVMKSAHGTVKVLLDGQGSDEMLAGYHSYLPYYFMDLIKNLLRNPSLSALVQLFSEHRAIENVTGNNLMRNLIKHALSRIGIVNQSSLMKYRNLFKDKSDLTNAHKNVTSVIRTDLNNILINHTTRGNLPNLLHFEDRSSTAFSIEARTPYLDYRLVEFSLGLPIEAKIKNGWTKHILRKSIDKHLPSSVTWRKDKLGYPVPVSKWFREYSNPIREVINSDIIKSSLLEPKTLNRILDDHIGGLHDNSLILWRIISFYFWKDLYR